MALEEDLDAPGDIVVHGEFAALFMATHIMVVHASDMMASLEPIHAIWASTTRMLPLQDK